MTAQEKAMKLSEILKDWPESKDWGNQQIGWPEGFNEALASCDREIDKEALAKELSHGLFKEADFLISDSSLSILTDTIISTMPTWLKRIEKV